MSDYPLLTLLPYLGLALAILALVALESGRRRGIVAAIAFGSAIIAGLISGALTPIALVSIAAFGALCYARHWSANAGGSPWMHLAATLAVIAASLALMAHVVPGFSNLPILRQVTLSPDAVPYTLYWNFDKPLIGLFIIGFGTHRSAAWPRMFRLMLPRAGALILVVMCGALAAGYVRLDPKWPAFLPAWLIANLLFTCTAEEALFRGVIQRSLQTQTRVPLNAPAAIAIAAVLFGLVHYAGGPAYVALATVAGAGYGWIFWRTGRLEAAILTHFLLNTIHLLAFTYPARAA